MRKLNAVIAMEKGIKNRTDAEVSTLHHQSEKPEPFTGLNRTYKKLNEEGEDLPSERKKVSLQADNVLKRLATLYTEAWDIEASKDWANCKAHADVVVNGQVIIKQAPVAFLLYLEKMVTNVRTFVDKFPTLDEAEDWTQDPNSLLYRTPITTTSRTKKVQKALVLYPATDKHPAQTQLVAEDVLAGYWETQKLSGALPVPRKAAILTKVDTLLKAIKEAREKANESDAPEIPVGEVLLNYLLV